MDGRLKEVGEQECKDMYDRERAAADSIVDNPQVLQQYAKRKKEIEKMRGDLEKLENECDNGQDKLDGVMRTWKTRLDNLTKKLNEKFGTYMKQMDCAGEVRLVEDQNDFSAWGLQLMVRPAQSGVSLTCRIEERLKSLSVW